MIQLSERITLQGNFFKERILLYSLCILQSFYIYDKHQYQLYHLMFYFSKGLYFQRAHSHYDELNLLFAFVGKQILVQTTVFHP